MSDHTTQPSSPSASILPPSSTDMPPSSDSATSDQHQGSQDTNGLYNYYFVFLALIICAAALAAFLMWRRKRKYGAVMRRSRETALERDLNAWDPMRSRRRYWQGRWRSADMGASREEGLNEYGEAPPPYVPKPTDEDNGPHDRVDEPAVPLQTLSREQAGLKPPDYTEVHVHSDVDGRMSTSDTGSSSQQQTVPRSGV